MAKKGDRRSAAAEETRDRVLAALEQIGDVTARSMFGGVGIFKDGDMFALVDSNGGLYFKADAETKKRYEAAGSAQHRPMPYFEVPESVNSDQEELGAWAREAIRVARATRKK